MRPNLSEEMPARIGLNAALKLNNDASQDCSNVEIVCESGVSSGFISFGIIGDVHEYEVPVEYVMKLTGEGKFRLLHENYFKK